MRAARSSASQVLSLLALLVQKYKYCRKLSALTARHLAVNADNKVRIVLAGGIEAVIAAMKEHRANAGLQEQACGALINLAANNNTDNKVRIAWAGGIDAVVAGTQFTRFTSTKVQILTPKELWSQVLSLLALLVQKYKY
jgi:hypothetical protein